MKDINFKYGDKLVDFAKYFANAKNTEVAVISDADGDGLDLTCKDRYLRN